MANNFFNEEIRNKKHYELPTIWHKAVKRFCAMGRGSVKRGCGSTLWSAHRCCGLGQQNVKLNCGVSQEYVKYSYDMKVWRVVEIVDYEASLCCHEKVCCDRLCGSFVKRHLYSKALNCTNVLCTECRFCKLWVVYRGLRNVMKMCGLYFMLCKSGVRLCL